ncbi:MAG: uroporphyrinogen decarboxylase, partial [Lachnospiraceae bacterium]|nr:uroporphyrinogen decarboxylase [Lachnospiraceae bacterium]
KDESAPQSDEIVKINYKGHVKFIEDWDPDYVKIMSDGFFNYPGFPEEPIKTAADLKKIKSGKPETLKWIDDQVAHVQNITAKYGKDIVTIYNVFSPASYLFIGIEGFKFDSIVKFYNEDPEALKEALLTIADDIKLLAARVIKEGGADGIYFSVGSFNGINKSEYQKYIAPAEKAVLEAANAVNDSSMLHICGFDGRRNDLTTYADYPVKVINWAVGVEGVSLSEGKKIFGGRAVVGGFANNANGVLYKGTKEEIKAETKKILSASGTQGVIIGADCTIPRDIPIEHLKWVREAAEEFGA